MDKNKSIILVAAIAVILILVGSYMLLTQDKDKGIVGMYHISQYDQYSMENGELTYNHSGDGTYDTEFIEITSCENGIFEGYCCVPKEGEVDPPHYPILGTYESKTGMIQYTCSYNYPQAGVYDWLHGYIIDGVMQLNGMTFGDDNSFYGAFEFTFIKEGYAKKTVTFDPIFEVGDVRTSFSVVETIEGAEVPFSETVSFKVINSDKGLYQFEMRTINSNIVVNAVGSTLSDGLINVIGYGNGAPFSLLMADMGDYIQINREYSNGESCMTWTAYLTKDGSSATIKESPKMTGITYSGTRSLKMVGGDVKTSSGSITVTTLSNTLIEMKNGATDIAYGNPIPYTGGTIIALSDSFKESSGTTYFMGFAFVNESMDTMYYSGLSMSADGTLSAIIFEGKKA